MAIRNSAKSKTTGIPIALTIAGSDSSGGAGIQADLKTFSALEVYGASVIAALTAQNTHTVTAVHEVPPQMVADQLEAVLDDLNVRAIKIGMLSNAEVIEAIAVQLKNLDVPIVLDPVMVAKSGDRLLRRDAISALKEKLLPLATVLTPNLPEAADLLGADEAQSETKMQEQAQELLALGPKYVLMKGGHAKGDTCVDFLTCKMLKTVRLEAPRLDTKNTHGTGCTLSSAIAAGLAKGLSVEDATRVAHGYLQGAIRAADCLNVGSGHGPVHHFYRLWSK